MSLFHSILRKLFPSDHPAVAQNASPPAANASQGVGTVASSPPATPVTTQPPPVDIEMVLNDMAQKNPEKLNWRTSIVDLMKLVGIDSSLNARKALAQELHYSGDTNDSASVNTWLHKQVMQKIAQNGGKVPEDLKN